jgi:hypothetical protein
MGTSTIRLYMPCIAHCAVQPALVLMHVEPDHGTLERWHSPTQNHNSFAG